MHTAQLEHLVENYVSYLVSEEITLKGNFRKHFTTLTPWWRVLPQQKTGTQDTQGINKNYVHFM
jgi:hypothetical protein